MEGKKERLGANLAALLCYLCRLSGYFTRVFSSVFLNSRGMFHKVLILLL